MSFKIFILGTIMFGIATIICAICAIICLIKESFSKNGILSILMGIGSLSVTLFASFQIKVPSPIILPLDNEIQTYNDNMEISIKSDEKSCNIYYTLDGSDPKNEGIKYSNAILLSASTTVCARSKFLCFWSELEQRSYEFNKNITDNSNEKSDNVQVYGDDNITITGNVSGDININTHTTSETTTSPKTEILETEESTQLNLGQALQYIYSNEEILQKEIINNEENKPIYSSIYPGVSYWYISEKVRLIVVANSFRDKECSRTYYFDENEKLTFALIKDNIGEHRLYFYDDILIRYIDETGQNYDLDQDLNEHDCSWTGLALEESYEIFNGVKKPSESDSFSVNASYDMNITQSSISGIDVMIKAKTTFPAERVMISGISDNSKLELTNMHGGKYEWYFKANFYIKGTYTVTVTAYDSEGESISDEFTYVY